MTDAQWQVVHDAICAARDGGADEAYAAWLAVLDAIAEPSEVMLAAANALPITAQVDSMIVLAATRQGGHTGLQPSPNSPIEQWYRAMVAALRKEIEDESR